MTARTDYSALDAAIVEATRLGLDLYSGEVDRLAIEKARMLRRIRDRKPPPSARDVIDRRLQVLRKRGQVEWSRAGGWSLVEQKP